MSVNVSCTAADFLSKDLNLNESGIFITAAVYQLSSNMKSIKIMGVCQEVNGEFSNIEKSLLNAVTLIYTREPYHDPVTQQVAGDTIVFHDDIQIVQNARRAYFDVDMFENSKKTPQQGVYYISASFGNNLSKVIKLSL
ncbi:MAG: hypothetical protein IMF17_04295 [Proteobacteria bacterium]|nr:hypothetical protein [Pseudomonadota bacterium]